MKVSIIEKGENPLLKRLEIRFEVDHTGGPTPKRLDVRRELASQLGVPEDMVVIEKFATTYGRQVASGIARAYDSRERLEELEPKYLLERGLPKEGEEEKPREEVKEKPPEKLLEEEPAEEKPPEKEEKPEGGKPPEKLPEEKPKEEKPGKPKEEIKEESKSEKEEGPEEVKEEPPKEPEEGKEGAGEEKA